MFIYVHVTGTSIKSASCSCMYLYDVNITPMQTYHPNIIQIIHAHTHTNNYQHSLLIASLYHSQISCSFAFDKASTTELHHTMALDCYDILFHAPLAAVAVPSAVLMCSLLIQHRQNSQRCFTRLATNQVHNGMVVWKIQGVPFNALPPAKKN